MQLIKTKIRFIPFFLLFYCNAFSQNIYQTHEFECDKGPEHDIQLSQIPNPGLIGELSIDPPSQECNIFDILHDQFEYIFSIFKDNPPRLQDFDAPIGCLIKIISCEKEAIDTRILQQYTNILDELFHQTPNFDDANSQSVLDFIDFLNKYSTDVV